MTIFRIAALVLLALAVICGFGETSIADLGQVTWAIGGLLAWCLDGAISTPVLGGTRREV